MVKNIIIGFLIFLCIAIYLYGLYFYAKYKEYKEKYEKANFKNYVKNSSNKTEEIYLDECLKQIKTNKK